MKNNYIYLFSFIIVVCILFSCTPSRQVVSGNLISKRKYNKGWYINNPKTISNYNYKNTETTEILQSPVYDTIIEKINTETSLQELYASDKIEIIYTEANRKNKPFYSVKNTPNDTTQKIQKEPISEDKKKECSELKKKANKNLGLTLTMILLIPIVYIIAFFLMLAVATFSALFTALVYLLFYVLYVDLIIMFFVYGVGAIIYGIRYRKKNCYKIKN